MAFLSVVYKYGIWISIPVLVCSILLLLICVSGVIRTEKEAELFRVPLFGRQEIEFTKAGKVLLFMEGPLLSSRFAGLKFELTGPDGMAVKSRPVLFRHTTTGLRTTRMGLKVYDIVYPGRYHFEIIGLRGEQPADGAHRMVFAQPHLARSMVYVIGIVLAGVLSIGSVVLFFLRLLNVVDS